MLVAHWIQLTWQTKSNRPDGSYATGDLYTPHSAKPNVWRYIGRGDDVVVMVRPLGVLAVSSRSPAEQRGEGFSRPD